MSEVKLHRDYHAVSAEVRPILSDYAEELIAAERGKQSARVHRKLHAKAIAINALVAMFLRTPTTPPDGEGR